MKTKYKVIGNALNKIETMKRVAITYYNPTTKALENAEKVFAFESATEKANEFKKALNENGFKIVEVVKENVKKRTVISLDFVNWENAREYIEISTENEPENEPEND